MSLNVAVPSRTSLCAHAACRKVQCEGSGAQKLKEKNKNQLKIDAGKCVNLTGILAVGAASISNN